MGEAKQRRLAKLSGKPWTEDAPSPPGPTREASCSPTLGSLPDLGRSTTIHVGRRVSPTQLPAPRGQLVVERRGSVSLLSTCEPASSPIMIINTKENQSAAELADLIRRHFTLNT
jgi:hypothetical protein